RVHTHDRGQRCSSSEEFPNAGAFFLDGSIKRGINRRISQLLAGDVEFRAALRQDSLAVVDLLAGIFKTAPSHLIRRLCRIELRSWNDALIGERGLTVAVRLRFLCQHPR